MADFSTQQFDLAGSPVRPESRATASSTAGTAAGIAAAGDTLADGLTIFSRRQAASRPTIESQRKAVAESLTGAYVERQQTLSQLVESGQMTEEEASTRSRAEYRSFAAANPQFAGELADIHAKFISPSLGPLVQDAQKETRARQEQWDAAVESGAIDTNASQNDQNVQFRQYTAMNSAQHQLEFINTQNQVQARLAFDYWMDNALDVNMQSYMTIANAHDIPEAQRLASLEARYNQHLADADKIGVKLNNPEDVDYAKSIMTRTYDLQRKIILGEIETEAANAELDNIKATKLLQAVNSNAAFETLLVLSELNLDSTVLLTAMKPIANGIARYYEDAANNIALNTNDPEKTLAHVKTVIIPNVGREMSEEGKEQLATQFRSLIRGAKAFAETPENGRDFVSVIANSRVGDHLAGNPEENFDARFDAVETIRAVYGVELAGIVKNELDANDKVQAVWSNGGVQFRGGRPIQTNRLNRKAAGLMNEYIRAVAHLQGHKDYRKVWEEIEKLDFSNQVGQMEKLKAIAKERGIDPNTLPEDASAQEIADIINEQGES
jgi:hypothetical protein